MLPSGTCPSQVSTTPNSVCLCVFQKDADLTAVYPRRTDNNPGARGADLMLNLPQVHPRQVRAYTRGRLLYALGDGRAGGPVYCRRRVPAIQSGVRQASGIRGPTGACDTGTGGKHLLPVRDTEEHRRDRIHHGECFNRHVRSSSIQEKPGYVGAPSGDERSTFGVSVQQTHCNLAEFLEATEPLPQISKPAG